MFVCVMGLFFHACNHISGGGHRADNFGYRPFSQTCFGEIGSFMFRKKSLIRYRMFRQLLVKVIACDRRAPRLRDGKQLAAHRMKIAQQQHIRESSSGLDCLHPLSTVCSFGPARPSPTRRLFANADSSGLLPSRKSLPDLLIPLSGAFHQFENQTGLCIRIGQQRTDPLIQYGLFII